jgi:protocatechuate 3,4-dioxygenase alpha subunit
MSRQTPSQTVGPFFAYGLTPEGYGRKGIAGPDLVGPDVQGRRLRIEGRVLDGAGEAVPDALLEIWQADAFGRYPHPGDARPGQRDGAFRGFGRCGTDADGRFAFSTVRPGADGEGAPHITLAVFARGLLLHAFTRIYFADEERANAADAVLALVPAGRRATLLARPTNLPDTWRFDIRLQGEGETVFFDF